MSVKITGVKPQVVDTVKRNLEIKPKTGETKTSTPPQAFANSQKDKLFGGNLLQAKLNNQINAQQNNGNLKTFSSVVAKAPVIDEKKVNDAVKTIKNRLSLGLLDWNVTHGDLKDIQKTLQGLNKDETNAVFKKLSDSDLKNWADELDGVFGSFSTAEKKQLFNELSEKLDVDQLSRMTNALGDAGNIQSLADSVANKASDETKVGFINRLKGMVETNEGSAKAVAELIAGLGNNPKALEGVLNGLSQTQLQAVMKAASQEEIHSSPGSGRFGGGGSIYTTFDPKPLADMISAVSKTGNAELKAKVFQAGANELKRIEDAGGLLNPVAGQKDSAKMVRDSLTNLLRSDTNGIMTNLEHNFRNGDGITAYSKSMLNAGETKELGNIIAKLSKGNDLKGSPLTRFGSQVSGTDGKPHYQSAQVLGYFAGALFSGAKQITSDRSKQADMLKNVFGTIAGATGAANPPAGVASSIVNGLTSAIVGEVTDGLNKGTMDMQEALDKLIYPRNTRGNTYEGAAEADYDSAFSRVVLRNS
jgi:hypothetical protein